jgi:hypothetical protein
MSVTAVASETWITVRCPCGRNTLGDVCGTDGKVRRLCRRCKGWWIIDCATGLVVGESPTSRASA